jgi:hypothetical protein
MSDDMSKVLDRVRKMLRLANDAAATEGERDNALRMAHATLAKHNLSLSMAEARGATPEEERGEGRMEGKNYPWMRTAAAAIAKLFFCEYLYVARRNGATVVHCFVGRASNTVTAQEMAQYIISSIDREARKYSRESYTGGTGWRSFCKGAAHQVYTRCAAIRAEAERPPEGPTTPSATGTAIVLASVYAAESAANRALIEATYGDKLKKSTDRQRNTSWGGFAAGTAYGKTVSLNTQLGSNGARKALK